MNFALTNILLSQDYLENQKVLLIKTSNEKDAEGYFANIIEKNLTRMSLELYPGSALLEKVFLQGALKVKIYSYKYIFDGVLSVKKENILSLELLGIANESSLELSIDPCWQT